MATKFQFHEIVRVIAQPPRIRRSVLHKEGIVVGMSEPYCDGKSDYGVHINEFMETFAIGEDLLESCGRVGERDDAVARPPRRKRGS